MRSIVQYAIIVLFPVCLSAQGVFTNETHSILQQVIGDYPARFVQIRGKLLNRTDGAVYNSTLSIPGSLKAVIRDNGGDSYSWQNDLYSSPHFDQARNRFKEVYDHLKNSIVKIDGQQPFILNGTYLAPAVDKKRNTIIYRPVPASPGNNKMAVMLCLHFRDQEWVVTLSVLDSNHPLHEMEDKITSN